MSTPTTILQYPPNIYPVRSIRYYYWQTAKPRFDGVNPLEVRIIERDGKKWSYHIEMYENVPMCVTRLDDAIKDTFPLSAIRDSE